MNEILQGSKELQWPRRGFFQRLVYTAAGSFALGGLCGWTVGRRWLRIERHDMTLPGLGKDLHGATLAHISDLHCSPLVRERYLRNCVDTINSLDVDLVAITGDFITGYRRHARRAAAILRDLSPRIATVACLGNHDYGIVHSSGLGTTFRLADYIAEQLAQADIFVMMNETRVFRRGQSAIQFVGLEDYWTPRYDPAIAFEMAHRHLPTVALCHNPDPAMDLARLGADWVLAGHTHGSPLAARMMKSENDQFVAGRYDLGENRYLYVTRGLGYGRRVNINPRPEITLFTLRDADLHRPQ